MGIPLARGAGREIVLMTLICGGAAVAGYIWFWPAGALFTLVWAAGLAFFRDPNRRTPDDPAVMVAPADGKVVETATLDNHENIGGPATRIGIFLSLFDVHVNRSPCTGVVRSIQHRSGQFLDARDPEAGRLNEANTIVIDPDPPHQGPVVVRQIAGLVARRIVCRIQVGDRVEAGERIGLIKFGSRTELILPGHDRYIPAVSVGTHAVGAETILARRARSDETTASDSAPGAELTHVQSGP